MLPTLLLTQLALRHSGRVCALGYVEGKNIIIEYRWAEGKPERLPDLAAELVRFKVDIIVTAGPAATGPAKEATSTIPIVMAHVLGLRGQVALAGQFNHELRDVQMVGQIRKMSRSNLRVTEDD